MRVRTVALALTLGASVVFGAAGCVTEERYEDCEVSDQDAHESDCGYYRWADGSYTLSDTVVVGAVWHWWSWVVVGQTSFAPSGWKPPHGLRPPLESSESKKRRKNHEKTIKEQQKKAPVNTGPTGARNGNTQPRTGSGNQGIPRNNPAPRPRR